MNFEGISVRVEVALPSTDVDILEDALSHFNVAIVRLKMNALNRTAGSLKVSVAWPFGKFAWLS